MTALPRELAPWTRILDLFPEDLAGELGRMVPRLALAVGPMRAASPVASGEPDGFSGIARRGSYERLLLSEWLLADEAPDEFARRATMGEHAFFHLQRRSPARALSSVAVFDAGPDQIGAPRIAHLAALIVLAARAERAGARFAWGMLGAPEAAMIPSVTPESVLTLLRARTAVASDDADVSAWAERAAKSGWEDAWLVGRAPGSTLGQRPVEPGVSRAAPHAWRHASLEIRDVLDPDRRVLSVIARPPRSPAREVELDLPDPRASVRLLRDPFFVTAPAPRRQPVEHAPISNLIFALNGTKLFARGASGDILSYPLPNSPREPVGRPKRYRPRAGGVVAAVGWVRRGLVMLVVRPDALVFEHTTTKGPDLLHKTIVRHGGARVAGPHASDPLSTLVYLDGGEEDEVLFLDARRTLLRVRDQPRGQRPGPPRIEIVASEVAALAASPTHVTFVGRHTETGNPAGEVTPRMGVQTLAPGAMPKLDSAWHLVQLRSDGQPSTQELLVGDGTFEAVFGRELCAVQQRGDAWTVVGRSFAVLELTPPASARVVGVAPTGPATAPELLLLEGDERTLSFVGRASSRSLPRAAAPIRDVAMNAWRGQLAYVTTAGEVVVHSLHEETPLARYLPEG